MDMGTGVYDRCWRAGVLEYHGQEHERRIR